MSNKINYSLDKRARCTKLERMHIVVLCISMGRPLIVEGIHKFLKQKVKGFKSSWCLNYCQGKRMADIMESQPFQPLLSGYNSSTGPSLIRSSFLCKWVQASLLAMPQPITPPFYLGFFYSLLEPPILLCNINFHHNPSVNFHLSFNLCRKILILVV